MFWQMILVQRLILGLLIAVLVFNLTQRRHLEHGEKKRFATLGIAGLVLVLYASSIVIVRFTLHPALLFIPAAVAVFLGYRFRKSLFIFPLRCSHCGENLPLVRSLYYDHNLCGSCIPDTSAEGPRSINEIDWENWIPDQDAVLCFTLRDDEVLLIHKKTGLGAGKINAPGGRIENGESAADAARRECREEVGIAVFDIEKRADLSFQFTDGFALHCSEFFASDHEGTAIATEEADPFWCSVEEIPFEKMWEDDAVWLPMALKGRRISGRFIFDGDTMISREIREVESFDPSSQT